MKDKGGSEVALGVLAATAFWLIVAILVGDPARFKDYAAPASTVFAAITAGWIAYRLGQSQIAVAKVQADIAERNWKTSNEKIVLDLFDKRLAIFEDIRGLVGEACRSGTAPDDLFFRYGRAIDRVPYFFGEDVQKYVEKIRLHLINLNLANTMMQNLIDPERPTWVKRRGDEFVAIAKFYEEAPRLFGPYMKAHQKA
ncbi:hypothetical protein ACVWXQ_001592 [Bradyrhizobium sp. S3.14.4]